MTEHTFTLNGGASWEASSLGPHGANSSFLGDASHSCTNADFLDLDTDTDFSIEGWFKLNSGGSNIAPCLYKYNGGSVDIQLSFDHNADTVIFKVNGVGISPTQSVQSDVFHHFVATYNAAAKTGILYYQGSAIGNGTVGTGRSAGAGTVYLNSDGVTTRVVSTDELRIYNRILTPTEISAHYAGTFTSDTAAHNLKLYLPFTEAAGTTAATATTTETLFDGEHEFTLVGGEAWTATGQPLGPNGSNYAFDGDSTHYATCPDFTSNDTDQDISIEFNFRPNGETVFPVAKSSANGNGYYVKWDTSASGTLYWNSSVSASGVTVGSVTNATWHHVVVTYNAATLSQKIYVDGVLSATAAADVNRAYGGGSQAGPLRLNVDRNGNNAGLVRVDEFRVYNTVLTLTEVEQHYANNYTGDVDSTLLRLYLPFTEGFGLSATTDTVNELARDDAFNGTLVMAEGAFTFTGEAMGFGITMPAAEGAFTFTGEAMGFALKMPCAYGSFALTGLGVQELTNTVLNLNGVPFGGYHELNEIIYGPDEDKWVCVVGGFNPVFKLTSRGLLTGEHYTKNTPGAPKEGHYVRGDDVTDSESTVWVCVETGSTFVGAP